MQIKDYEFRLRLFISVDLTGSTAYKQKSDRWVQVFDAFFEEFPPCVQAQYPPIKCDRGGTPPPPEVWKYIGDEVLFVVELRRYEDAAVHLFAIRQAMDRYEETLRTKTLPLGLKATAWIAGFPVQNSEVWLNQHGASDLLIRDYLGPSIDLGFRLTQFADKRRIPISVDLAYLLAKSSHHLSKEHRAHVLYGSSESLKGILEGQPYPVLWVDRRNGEVTAEDKLRKLDRECDPGTICDYCDELFHSSLNPCLARPFIEDDEDTDMSRIPEGMRKRRDGLRGADADYAYGTAKEELDVKDGTDSSKPPPLPPVAPNKPPPLPPVASK